MSAVEQDSGLFDVKDYEYREVDGLKVKKVSVRIASSTFDITHPTDLEKLRGLRPGDLFEMTSQGPLMRVVGLNEVPIEDESGETTLAETLIVKQESLSFEGIITGRE